MKTEIGRLITPTWHTQHSQRNGTRRVCLYLGLIYITVWF
jgi:hypothetical protein